MWEENRKPICSIIHSLIYFLSTGYMPRPMLGAKTTQPVSSGEDTHSFLKIHRNKHLTVLMQHNIETPWDTGF